MAAILMQSAFIVIPVVTMAQETATPPPDAETATETAQADDRTRADEISRGIAEGNVGERARPDRPRDCGNSGVDDRPRNETDPGTQDCGADTPHGGDTDAPASETLTGGDDTTEQSSGDIDAPNSGESPEGGDYASKPTSSTSPTLTPRSVVHSYVTSSTYCPRPG